MMIILGDIFWAILLKAIEFIYNGLVLSNLWGWFMVPTFGLPKVSVTLGIGIVLIVSLLTVQYTNEGDDDYGYFWKIFQISLYNSFVKPSVALSIGYFVHLSM